MRDLSGIWVEGWISGDSISILLKKITTKKTAKMPSQIKSGGTGWD